METFISWLIFVVGLPTGIYFLHRKIGIRRHFDLTDDTGGSKKKTSVQK